MSLDALALSLVHFRENERVPTSFHLHVTFEGPLGDAAHQRLRADVAFRICPPGALASTPLMDTLRSSTSRICLVRASIRAEECSLMPKKVRDFFCRSPTSRPTPDKPIGFYVYDESSPCSLLYLCMEQSLRGLRIAGAVLRHYEEHLRKEYGDACRNVYLTSVNVSKVIAFYRRHDYVPVASSSPAFAYTDGTGEEHLLKIPCDTVLMTKRLSEALHKSGKRALELVATELDVVDDDEPVEHETRRLRS